ncbi:hypothetical protein JK636_16015 [Clostridium sp. YIM B02515]|uniref:Uncharacterized protein n=1 Tax=Clostridium rhizosphaerae TaxID=2803861 RepID=A0ABS1TG00_9CLOT|nr:hypothetical protein [Clostridium rhizosphaerae]MBL4937234.1 hypothetical protein [Clostridium rhizosphaerae]
MKQFVVVCMQQVRSAQLTNQLVKDHNKYINFLAFPWSQISIGLSIRQPLLLFVGLLVRKILGKNIANTKGRQ